MKVKLNVGAEFDVLSKDELDDSLKQSAKDFARLVSDGIRYGKSSSSSLSSVGPLLNPPVLASATPNAGGGTFAAGTYFYKATATTTFGETTASNEVSATVALNGTITVAFTCDPNTVTVKIYRGTATNAENALVGTVNVNGATSGNFVDTGGAGSAATPPGSNTANTTKLNTTPTYSGGYLALPIGPNPGYVWSIKNLTYLNFPTSGVDFLINGYSNGDTAYALLNGGNANGTTIIGSNGLIVPAGNDIYLGFRGAATNATLILYYEEVKLEDIGKL